jgi:regulation of enolase protein 1 (concanavalin A-like superfamily)
MFKINDAVIVRSPREEDFWQHAFQGRVKEIKEDGLYVIVDQEDDCWDVDEYMLSLDPADGYCI